MLSNYVGLRQKDLGCLPDARASDPVHLAFEGIRTQIEAVARLHRSLTKRANSSGVDLGEYIRHVCRPFMSGLSDAIEVSEELVAGCLVRSDQILPLTQIVSEVITNAIKYAHVEGETGHLYVRCRSLTDTELELEIVDDGMGLPRGFNPLTATGLGFRLIRALAAQIGAESGFESSAAGTRFWLRMESALDDKERSDASNAIEQTGTGFAKSQIP
jgi:two-component sensor histidine kinase